MQSKIMRNFIFNSILLVYMLFIAGCSDDSSDKKKEAIVKQDTTFFPLQLNNHWTYKQYLSESDPSNIVYISRILQGRKLVKFLSTQNGDKKIDVLSEAALCYYMIGSEQGYVKTDSGFYAVTGQESGKVTLPIDKSESVYFRFFVPEKSPTASVRYMDYEVFYTDLFELNVFDRTYSKVRKVEIRHNPSGGISDSEIFYFARGVGEIKMRGKTEYLTLSVVMVSELVEFGLNPPD